MGESPASRQGKTRSGAKSVGMAPALNAPKPTISSLLSALSRMAIYAATSPLDEIPFSRLDGTLLTRVNIIRSRSNAAASGPVRNS